MPQSEAESQRYTEILTRSTRLMYHACVRPGAASAKVCVRGKPFFRACLIGPVACYSRPLYHHKSICGERSRLLPRKGLEPPRCCHHWYLKPARLPIPPSGRSTARASVSRRRASALPGCVEQGGWNVASQTLPMALVVVHDAQRVEMTLLNGRQFEAQLVVTP